MLSQSRRKGRSLSLLICLIALVISQPACETIDRVHKIPGLEDAQVRDAMRKRPRDSGEPSGTAQLQANPPQVRFDSVPVASQRQQVIVVSNPATFPVTIVHVSLTGCDFAVLSGAGPSAIVSAKSDITFTVTFQPSQRRTCSGALLIEIDSAGGRFMRIPLRGQAI